MAGELKFESRTGRLDHKPESIYKFVTDLRNLKQFIPDKIVDGLSVERESCSFKVTYFGHVSARITERKPFSRVVITGSAMKPDDFSLMLDIMEGHDGETEVRITVDTELNPFLKMMVEKPVRQFLETVIDEMEKFDGWDAAML